MHNPDLGGCQSYEDEAEQWAEEMNFIILARRDDGRRDAKANGKLPDCDWYAYANA